MAFAVVASLCFLQRLLPSLQVSALLSNIHTPGPQHVVIILGTQGLQVNASEFRKSLEVFRSSPLEALVLNAVTDFGHHIEDCKALNQLELWELCLDCLLS